jgi:hypothetical protein
MTLQPNEMDYPVERIREMKAWTFFRGFAGARCGGCMKKANVPVIFPGWLCVCGTFNSLPTEEVLRDPFDVPDYGPLGQTILDACKGGMDDC